jgi:hypothetical protein
MVWFDLVWFGDGRHRLVGGGRRISLAFLVQLLGFPFRLSMLTCGGVIWHFSSSVA